MSDAVIFISGVRISAGFNRETGELAEATGHVTELKAGVTTDENRTVSALIIPQTIPADTRLVKIQFHGKEFHYTLPEMMEYKGGHSYKYSLKVTDQSLSVIETGSGNINDMENKVW